MKNPSSSQSIPRTHIEPASQLLYLLYFFKIILGHLFLISLIHLSLFLRLLFELLDLHLLIFATFAQMVNEVSVSIHHVFMRGLQLFMRVVQDTVQQIDVDSTLVFRAGSSHPHPAFMRSEWRKWRSSSIQF